MATLAADKPRVYGGNVEPLFNHLPIIADDIVYEGSAVGESSTSGTYRPLVGADTFVGFAHEKCDNASGAASAKNIKVRQKGIVKLAVTGASGVTDHGVAVYASDDDTFTLTSSSAYTQIGKVHRWITSTTCEVYFEGVTVRSI